MNGKGHSDVDERFSTRPVLTILFACWIIALFISLSWFQRSKSIESEGNGNSNLLSDSSKGEGACLLLFLDQECPCGSASLENLDRIASEIPRGTEVRICFPKAVSSSNSRLTSPSIPRFGKVDQLAKQYPWVTEIFFDSATIQQCGVHTSGHLIYWDHSGNLLFSGGITPGRGHVGDCRGLLMLRECFRSCNVEFRTSPVFGCSLKARKPLNTRIGA